jgi:hypothetical protein
MTIFFSKSDLLFGLKPASEPDHPTSAGGFIISSLQPRS